MSVAQRFVIAAVLAAAAVTGCAALHGGDQWCPPVDPGGDCFLPSDTEFVAHAIESTSAWTQLRGTEFVAGGVVDGFDEASGQRTWIVPLLSNGRAVAASRFIPFEGYVRLAEVAVYVPPRAFPMPPAGKRLILSARICPDPSAEACLFQNYGWRIE